ncbi:hypothetical protein V3F56_04500 [Moorellaceae bacterium AZ2]
MPYPVLKISDLDPTSPERFKSYKRMCYEHSLPMIIVDFQTEHNYCEVTLDLSPTGLKFLPSEMKALERISKRHGWLDRFDITPTKARFFYGNWSDPSEQEDYSFLLKDVLKWVDKHIPRSHIFAVLTAPVYATVQVSVG